MVFRGETGAAIKQATRVLVGAASRGAPYELQDVATAENGDSRVASVLMAGFDSSTRHALEGLSPELKLDACQPCQVEHLLEEHPYSLLLYNAVELLFILSPHCSADQQRTAFVHRMQWWKK